MSSPCDLVLEQICNYCNLTEAPDGLTNTAALMVRGLVNSVQLQNENMHLPQRACPEGIRPFPLPRRRSSWRRWQLGRLLTDYKAQLNAIGR